MKKKALKEAVMKAMKNYTCSVFSGRNQHECVTLEKEAKDFFSDANVLARALNPQTYFEEISTVALREVNYPSKINIMIYTASKKSLNR